MLLEPCEIAQVPRGHRVPRDEVIASQRSRMLYAMAETVAEKGFAAATVADVLKRARVSRETFYEQFENKQACFSATYDAGVEEMFSRLAEALAPLDDEVQGLARFAVALSAYLSCLAEDEAFARTFLLEVYAAGPSMFHRRVSAHERFIDEVQLLLVDHHRFTGLDRFTCEVLTGSIASIVTMRVASGRCHELPALHEPILAVAERLISNPAAEPHLSSATTHND